MTGTLSQRDKIPIRGTVASHAKRKKYVPSNKGPVKHCSEGLCPRVEYLDGLCKLHRDTWIYREQSRWRNHDVKGA